MVSTDSEILPARASALLRIVERLAEIGARPEETRDERLRAGALILASVLVAVLAFAWVITYAVRGAYLSAAIPAAYQVLTVIGLVVLARTKAFGVFRTMQFVMFVVLPPSLQLTLGGFAASSGIALWSMVTPLAALALLGIRRAVPWLLGYFTVVLLLAVFDHVVARSPVELPSGLRTAFYVLNITGATLSAFALLGYFVHQRELAHAALQAERERSERLLLNVLPAPIAERLKRHEGVIAEHHDAVTVLFADLVGFTAQTAAMPAEELVRLLDRIFSSFDVLAGAEGLEKIKTIGDAYMLAGGIPEPRPDHAEAVARVALAMLAEVTSIAGEGTPWLQVRIGIDTGPAVAGVIGQRKFIYDLWGDTVNTASRMESHGVPGKVQVSHRTAERLRAAGFALEPRGAIDVKGKGPMETFLLVG